MEFLTVRDFRASSKKIWEHLADKGKMVITNNGRPTALLLDIQNEDLEDILNALNRLESLRVFYRMRAEAEKRGFLSDQEIAAEIRAARADLQKTKKRAAVKFK